MIVFVSLDQLEDNPYQTRQEYGDIGELAADIKRHHDDRPDTLGLQQIPSGRVILRGGVTYQILNEERIGALVYKSGDRRLLPPGRDLAVQLEFGHRRLRAFRYLEGVSAPHYRGGVMPVDIRPLTDDQLLDGVWSENYARRSLSAVEEAELLQKKAARAGNQAAVADAWGIARSTVSNKLRLLSLPAEVQAANRAGRLSERQCLDLLAVMRIAAFVGPETSWRADTTSAGALDEWGPPLAPADFLERVVANGSGPAGGVSSDDIREYVRRATMHAGDELFDAEAVFDAGDDAKVRQPTCKGCQARMDQHCLDRVCHRRKRELIANQEIMTAAERLRLRWSVEPADFEPFATYDGADKMAKLVKGGGCEHLVVGWDDRNHNSASRPARDGETAYASMREIYGKEPAMGVVYGHAGPLKRECQAAIARVTAVEAQPRWNAGGLPHADRMPDGSTLHEWTKQVEHLKSLLRVRFADLVAFQVQNLKAMRALCLLAEVDTTEKLVEFLVRQGKAFNYMALEHAEQFHAAAGKLLADAGLPAGAWPALKPDEEALVYLNLWYNSQRSWHFVLNDRNREVIGALKRVAGSPGLSVENAQAVAVAVEDVDWWLAKYFPDQSEAAPVDDLAAVMS